MALKETLIVRHVFQSYPLFYQPYIPPVMEAFSQHPDLNFKIHVYKEGQGPYVSKLPNYYYRRVIEKALYVFKKTPYPLNFLEWKAQQQHVDILHIQDSFLFKKVYGLLQIEPLKRPKVVITLRGSDTYVKPWIQQKWQYFYQSYGHKVDAFIVMSCHQKQYLHEKWGISLERIHVIPISFGHQKTSEPKYPDKNVIKIVSAFRMCWEKNVDGNLRAIAYLKSQGLPVVYDLYGDGPDAGQVYYLIDKYGLQEEVNYHGRVDNSTLKKRLVTYDFFLQLSHSESISTSVLESQSCGLPAIVSNSGGLPEAIVPDKSGFAVTAHDAESAAKRIIELWRDPEQYKAFSKQAILYSQNNYTVNNEVDRLITLYKSLVNHSE